jgi:hypothetical protein
MYAIDGTGKNPKKRPIIIERIKKMDEWNESFYFFPEKILDMSLSLFNLAQ